MHLLLYFSFWVTFTNSFYKHFNKTSTKTENITCKVFIDCAACNLLLILIITIHSYGDEISCKMSFVTIAIYSKL